MNSLTIVLILIVLLILSYVAYYIIAYYLLPAPPLRIGDESIDLSKSTIILNGTSLSKTIHDTAGYTLVFYINPILNDRTSQSGNEYATPVDIGGNQKLKILIAPDAGRSITMSPAKFDIVTEATGTSTAIIETIELSDFPLQRWTGVAIVKQGSKFNIYINGILSASHKCTAMPVFGQTEPLKVGDTRLNGQIALMSLAPYPMQAADIKSMYLSTVDTKGKPYLSSGVSFFQIPTINISGMCPGGNCLAPMRGFPYEELTSSYSG